MPLLVLLLIPSILLLHQQPPTACAELASCRQAAMDAAARRDYEAFHDLAWRTAQKGRPNDPELMHLIARAQSLSGRPGDALVMLRRLADMGVATDARESPDFERVRALPGWPALEAAMAAATANRSTPPVAAPATPAAAAVRPDDAERSRRVESEMTPHPADRSSPPGRSPRTARTADTVAAAAAGEDAIALEGLTIDPIGIAYDTTSRRFIVGDARASKLIVADEVFRHVNDLIGAASGGFGALSGVEIDGRRGDLWVTSTGSGGAAALHKLQLVSGRILSAIPVPEEAQPAAFRDLSVSEGGALLLLDSVGARLFALKPGSRTFDKPLPLDVRAPSSVAPAGAVAYIAHEKGVSLADLATGHVTALRTAPEVDLAGLRKIRWRRGMLIALRASADGSVALVRVRLGRGGAVATALEPIDAGRHAEGTALTISGDAAYYVVRTSSGPAVRRVPLP